MSSKLKKNSTNTIGARMPQLSDELDKTPLFLEKVDGAFRTIYNDIQTLKIDIEQINDGLDRLYREISKNSEND